MTLSHVSRLSLLSLLKPSLWGALLAAVALCCAWALIGLGWLAPLPAWLAAPSALALVPEPARQISAAIIFNLTHHPAWTALAAGVIFWFHRHMAEARRSGLSPSTVITLCKGGICILGVWAFCLGAPDAVAKLGEGERDSLRSLYYKLSLFLANALYVTVVGLRYLHHWPTHDEPASPDGPSACRQTIGQSCPSSANPRPPAVSTAAVSDDVP